jgi:hemerythrin-like domain-containing protein
MITITDALISEHQFFKDLFDQLEGLLPGLKTSTEVRLFAALLERLLRSHADAEDNLAYIALDHALDDQGHLERLHHEHQEIDDRLRRAQTATDFEEARHLLQTAIAASRDHFLYEEQNIFPLLERVLQPDTLKALGTARCQARATPALPDDFRLRRSARRFRAT